MRLACTGRALQLSGLASVSRNCSGGQCSSFPPYFATVDDSLCGFASFDVRTEKGTEIHGSHGNLPGIGCGFCRGDYVDPGTLQYANPRRSEAAVPSLIEMADQHGEPPRAQMSE